MKKSFEFSLKVFKIGREDIKRLRDKEIDWGKVLLEEIKGGAGEGKRCVIIIDEIHIFYL